MNRISKGKACTVNPMVVALVAMMIAFPIVPGLQTEARADGAGAFVGGMIAAHVIGGAVRRDQVRTAAAVETANNSRQQAAPAPAAAAPQTQEQKMQQLDKLAAGGYIPPAEYKARKKAIVDGN